MRNPPMTLGGASARPTAYTVGPGYRYAFDDDLCVRLPIVRDNPSETKGLNLAAYIEEPDLASAVEVEILLRHRRAA